MLACGYKKRVIDIELSATRGVMVIVCLPGKVGSHDVTGENFHPKKLRPDVEQLEEAGQREHVAYFVGDVLHDEVSALGFYLLA